MSALCTGQPVSWLRLELYHLGELPAGERRTVDGHLQSCAVCRAALASIADDTRRLAPLPDLDALPVGVAPTPGPGLGQRLWTWLSGPGGRLLPVAVAGLAGLAALLIWSLPGGPPPLPGGRFKGGEAALVLLRERQGAVQEDARRFLDGDRLRLELTCPPGAETSWEVVAFQGAEVYLPLPGGERLPCGNRVALPGALRVDGPEPVTVCVLLGTPGADARTQREAVERGGRAAVPSGALCHTVTPRL